MSTPSMEHCVICGKRAITTAALIPVCAEHFEAYRLEAEQYRWDRPFYQRLQDANDQRITRLVLKALTMLPTHEESEEAR